MRGGIARFSQDYVKKKDRAAFNLHILDWNLRYWARNAAIGDQYAANAADALTKGTLMGRMLQATAQNAKLTFRIPVFQGEAADLCMWHCPCGIAPGGPAT